jgi:hypothetical protein
MHKDTVSILIHGCIFTIKTKYSLTMAKKVQNISNVQYDRRKGRGVNIRIVVRTDTKTCEMNGSDMSV